MHPYPHHPLQLVIEQAWDAGHTVRLLVFADAQGLDMPAHVVAKHRPLIPLDLVPSYPLRPTFDARGLHVDFSFGHVVRCTIPWTAMLTAIDERTGIGYTRTVTQPHLERSSGDVAAPAPASPFRVIKGGKDD